MKRFDSARARIGRFDPAGRKLLIPSMAPSGSPLLAACFRAAGIETVVMETYQGLSLGKEFTSGKECFPCMVTLGDILSYLQKEKDRLGNAFSPEKYMYFMPEAGGPCRFGMYNTLQRLVVDRFPEFREMPIATMTADDNYSSHGIIPDHQAGPFRKLSLNAVIIADIMDRMLWRVRPYESREGATDDLWATSVTVMAEAIAAGGLTPDYGLLTKILADTARSMRSLMDHGKGRRPRIGIVGEVYVRCHTESNQNLIRQIERCGGEVVNSSVAEWFLYVSYLKGRENRRRIGKSWRNRDLGGTGRGARRWLDKAVEDRYVRFCMRRLYGCVQEHLDIESDHDVRTAERQLMDDRHFSFDVSTETPLSIGGALEFVHEGFNGVVNLFPFTCMPGTMASAVLNPLLNEMKVPYLEASYDGTIQTNREIAIRTFVRQARQHQEGQHVTGVAS